jgi:hypothetical protein
MWQPSNFSAGLLNSLKVCKFGWYKKKKIDKP